MAETEPTSNFDEFKGKAGADLRGGCRGCAPLPEMTYGFLIQLVFCKKVWFIGVSYAIPKWYTPS